MNRRGFLGTVIGTVAGIAFTARPINRYAKWTIAFRELKSGFTIAAPAVESIVKIENGWEFRPQTLEVNQAMAINHFILYYKGKEVKQSKFTTVRLAPGDKLKAWYKLTFDKDFESPEAMMEAYLAQRSNVS